MKKKMKPPSGFPHSQQKQYPKQYNNPGELGITRTKMPISRVQRRERKRVQARKSKLALAGAEAIDRTQPLVDHASAANKTAMLPGRSLSRGLRDDGQR